MDSFNEKIHKFTMKPDNQRKQSFSSLSPKASPKASPLPSPRHRKIVDSDEKVTD
jgi:hypothetical protein